METTMRRPNTNHEGKAWTRAEIDAVWRKATVVPGYDPDLIRQDACNTWIHYSEFGTRAKDGVGWEIDHIKPVSQCGGDDPSNLQPLQWENNRGKGDDWPTWKCAKIAR